MKLVQSINASVDADAKRRLIAGDLNVLACECGRRTQLAANVVFHDPGKNAFIRVVPGLDEEAVAEAEAQFRGAGITGSARIVPTLNALVEKVKILDAGLADWAIELVKVLLLATVGDLDRVLLFDRLDNTTLHWILFDDQTPRAMASPLAAYDHIVATRHAPSGHQIDRAWAVEAARSLLN